MRDMFITSNNFKEYMKEALNIYVASSFLNRAIIDDIKANLNQLPFKGGRNFKFLLNKDFHEDSEMRKILINMLLELPHTEVRIYQGPQYFHPKLYIFEEGNNMFTAIGSFNATAGGAGKNIEAGIKTLDRQVYHQAKVFFASYWDSPNTEVARYDKSAIFVERKFQPGDAVLIKVSKDQGVVLNDPPILIRITKEWEYSVFVNGGRKRIKESELEHVDVAIYRGRQLENENYSQNDIIVWMKNYILEKVLNLTDKTIASFASSRTEILAYQFRPLFKILQSDNRRILIADEVGLGKTIEAGIILKELLSRMDMKRILIVVPNSLKDKWRDELRIRFDEYYSTISAHDIIAFLNDYCQSPDGAQIEGIITYDQLVTKSLRNKLDAISDMPRFDIIIMDEAHHLKNANTFRHRAIKKISKNAGSIVMLTATPIQLGTVDLYNMLSILLSEETETDSLAFSARLTVVERINKAIMLLNKRNFNEFKTTIRELDTNKAFQKELEGFSRYHEIISKCKACNKSISEAKCKEIILDLTELNFLNQYLTRTLRREVSEMFPDREIKTYEYEYTDSEKMLYDTILELCRRKYSVRRRSAISFVMPERRAASSIIAMCRSFQTKELDKLMEEYDNNLEKCDDDDENSAKLDMIEIHKLSSLSEATFIKIDSKLKKLKTIIDGVFKVNKKNEDKKIMVFCTFIATVDYLKKNLERFYPEAYIESITGQGDDVDARSMKKERFHECDKPSVLICTEVAGEGLDFQFCHYLINYDMPWNPSKLEQRVGRIDRIGQKAEKIVVINLVNKYTIEDHIMAKLFERVKLFNSTIGPLGDLISTYQKNFSIKTLVAKRTEEEKIRYERQVLTAIENKKREQEIFEGRQHELVGVMDCFYDEMKKIHELVGVMDCFYDEMKKNRSYFQETEIRFIWEYYIAEYERRKDISIEEKQQGSIYSIPVNNRIKEMLLKTVRFNYFGKYNAKKKDYYAKKIQRLYDEKSDLLYTFNHECALKDMKVQYLNITHPFIQGAIYFIKDGYLPNKGILTCEMATNKLPRGDYVLLVYRFNVMDHKNSKIEFVEEKFFIYDVQKRSGEWVLGREVLGEIMAKGKISNCNVDIIEILKGSEAYLDNETKDMGQNVLEHYKKMDSLRTNKKKFSLHSHYIKEIKNIRRAMAFVHDQRMRGNYLKQINAILEEEKFRMAKLDERTLKIIVKGSGTIALTNKEEADA